jgi:hypothetical protein
MAAAAVALQTSAGATTVGGPPRFDSTADIRSVIVAGPTEAFLLGSAGSPRTGAEPGIVLPRLAPAATSVAAPSRATSAGATISVTFDAGFMANGAAQSAFNAAVGIWEGLLKSPVPITVIAGFDSTDASGAPLPAGLLGATAPSQYRNSTSEILYPKALADRLNGTDLAPSIPDIVTLLNARPTDGVGGTIAWYFGTDGKPPAGQVDFESVALHELTHGLGFDGFLDDSSGVGNYDATVTVNGQSEVEPVPTVFDGFVTDGTGKPVLRSADNSATLGNQLLGEDKGLRFRDAATSLSVPLYSPSTWSPGSSVYHTDPTAFPPGTAGALMDPDLPPGAAIHDPGPNVEGILDALGWGASAPAVPGSPTGLEVTPGNGQATITWTGPTGGSLPLTGYQVTVTPSSGQPVRGDVLASPVTVTGLTNGTAYSVSVVASDVVGPSAAATATVTPSSTPTSSTSSTSPTSSSSTTSSASTTSTTSTSSTTASTSTTTSTTEANAPTATTTGPGSGSGAELDTGQSTGTSGGSLAFTGSTSGLFVLGLGVALCGQGMLMFSWSRARRR